MLIQLSEEDAAFLVTLPEWDERTFNPVTHGDSCEVAAANGRETIEYLVAVARKNGGALPEPEFIEVVG
jgi:predicted RNase H-like HicB family nuclease